MVKSVWDELTSQSPFIELDQFIVMPNHVHGILALVGAPLVGARNETHKTIRNDLISTKPDLTTHTPVAKMVRAPTRGAPTVGNVIGAFKSITTDRYIGGVHQYGWEPFQGKLWQRNYYERVIRDEQELNQIREYIQNNPARWDQDVENMTP